MLIAPKAFVNFHFSFTSLRRAQNMTGMPANSIFFLKSVEEYGNRLSEIVVHKRENVMKAAKRALNNHFNKNS
jgi:hypothetical protein